MIGGSAVVVALPLADALPEPPLPSTCQATNPPTPPNTTKVNTPPTMISFAPQLLMAGC